MNTNGNGQRALTKSERNERDIKDLSGKVDDFHKCMEKRVTNLTWVVGILAAVVISDHPWLMKLVTLIFG